MAALPTLGCIAFLRAAVALGALRPRGSDGRRDTQAAMAPAGQIGTQAGGTVLQSLGFGGAYIGSLFVSVALVALASVAIGPLLGSVDASLAMFMGVGAGVAGLVLGPALVFVGARRLKFTPIASFGVTLLLAVAGLLIGRLAGAWFEGGDLSGGGRPSQIGSVLGGWIFVAVANIRRSDR